MASKLTSGVGEDTVANFIRWGGIAAILGGALMGFTDIYHTVAQQLISEYSGSSTEQLGSVIFLIGRVLIVFGLPALYLHHAASAGNFGFIAFALAMLGNTLMVASDWSEVFIAPILRGLDASLFENPPARIMIGFAVSFIPETLGWLLFGLSAFRARAYPKAASVLLALGILMPLLPFSPSWIFVIPYGAIVWMGLVITRAASLQRVAALA
jgi:hypothetical protein